MKRPEEIELPAVIKQPGEVGQFRPIHYIGNKWRILDAIETVVDSLSMESSVVCDLFAGTGVVAARLAQSHPVFAADIQEYSRVLTSALLIGGSDGSLTDESWAAWLGSHREENLPIEVRRLIDFEASALAAGDDGESETVVDLVEHGSLQMLSQFPTRSAELRRLLSSAKASVGFHNESVILRYYGGPYFSYRQAVALDAYALLARAMPTAARMTAIAALVSTASEIVSTVGSQFAQPMQLRARDGQIKSASIRTIIKRRSISVPNALAVWVRKYRSLPGAANPWQVDCLDYAAALRMMPPTVKVVYADPPYTRDHYSRFYHVLETLALGDEPGVSMVGPRTNAKLSRAVYRVGRHQSPFSIVSTAPDAFRALFAGVAERRAKLVLSYSPYVSGTAARPNTRVLTIERLLQLARPWFKAISVIDAGHVTHSKLNRQDLNMRIDHNEEVLIIAS